MLEKGIQIKGSEVLILGATFKENTPDTRNSKVPIIAEHLKNNGANVFVHDPLIEGFKLNPPHSSFDAIILAVPHHVFKDLDMDGFFKNKTAGLILDIKNTLGEKHGVFSL